MSFHSKPWIENLHNGVAGIVRHALGPTNVVTALISAALATALVTGAPEPSAPKIFCVVRTMYQGLTDNARVLHDIGCQTINEGLNRGC